LKKICKRFFKKLVKLWKWNKFLWNDFDFDHSYLLKVIKFKLDLMEPVIRDGYAINSEKTADEIKKTSELLELLINDNFSVHLDLLSEKYGAYDFKKFSNGFSSLNRTNVTDENKEEYWQDVKEAMRLDGINKKKVQTEFFKMLRKYENWWD
jgi:hypothetical protein